MTNNEHAEKIMRLYRDAEIEAKSRRLHGDEPYQLAVGKMIGLRQAAEAVCTHPSCVPFTSIRSYDVCAVCGAALA